jgi:hypothetical protein
VACRRFFLRRLAGGRGFEHRAWFFLASRQAAPKAERWRATALQIGVTLAIIILLGLAPATRAANPPLNLAHSDVVAVIGGEDMVAAQQNGWLEAALIRPLGADAPKFRYLAWEGDTVFAQPRDLNFPNWPEQLKRTGATVIFCQFGQTESLRGRGNLPNFLAAYGELLDIFSAHTQRIVVLSPTPFEDPGGLLPKLAVRNDDLSAYVGGIRELSAKRGLPFIDVFAPLQAKPGKESRLTRDGLHLNERGHELMSRQLALSLEWNREKTVLVRQDAPLAGARPDPLREAIIAKNQLWFHYWRPQNWAFLAGDRTEQPSSRDHRDPKVRWFPTELQEFLPMIAAKEKEIAEIAAKQSREGVR